jgi:hypothetical protein
MYMEGDDHVLFESMKCGDKEGRHRKCITAEIETGILQKKKCLECHGKR